MLTKGGTLLTTPCCLTCTMVTEAGSLLTIPCCLTCTMITEAGSLLTTPCYLTCTIMTETDTLLTTPCYLTCTMTTQVGNLFTTTCCLSCTSRASSYQTLLSNMYHRNRSSQSTHNTLLPQSLCNCTRGRHICSYLPICISHDHIDLEIFSSYFSLKSEYFYKVP